MVKVEIFSGPQCTYCEQAKALLTQNDIPYIDYDISQTEHMQEFARRLPRLRAIPQIFINDNHIGNEEDLKMMAQDGRLEALIG
ncbi:MAG: thioredoxin family protein [Anaerolineae bacterium]|jgi:glutaredoxin 3|nr:thioredoxin family protein [Anaerolineae bacterium]